ncbi:4-hydroxy-2-oxovalerate aldolase [Vibrio variabilis]|uniref:4-hydroxy-2-oxovalerate aldolase n=1 Tax=Vibrio variabilis TaxID=990271 RepID=A0ABQ0JG03_9VIBR|nr:4-hydroxy-2-oxovalerate aldolase [Vibrio variabilis]
MTNFKQQLNEKDLIGTFVKTPHPHIVEVLSMANLPFIILDAEHSPFDRTSLDQCILAARAHNLPCLVRVENSSPSTILNALDCGATGVQVPHVCSAEQAKQIVRQCHYGHRGRGYAGSSRAAQYATKAMPKHLTDSQAITTVIAQIEDPEGVDNADAIAAVKGIDAIFIGQVDLTVAYGAETVNDEVVRTASFKVIEAAKRAGKPVGMFVATAEQANQWREAGVSFFAVGSEHKMIIDGFRSEQALFNS